MISRIENKTHKLLHEKYKLTDIEKSEIMFDAELSKDGQVSIFPYNLYTALLLNGIHEYPPNLIGITEYVHVATGIRFVQTTNGIWIKI